MPKADINKTIEVKDYSDTKQDEDSVFLSFRFEAYSFSPETAKELGEALIDHAENLENNEGN